MSSSNPPLSTFSNEILLAILAEVDFPTIYGLLDSSDVLGSLSKICLEAWAMESIDDHVPSADRDGFWMQLHETHAIMVGEVVLAALHAVERRPQWCLTILCSARGKSSWIDWLERRGWRCFPAEGRGVPTDLKVGCDDIQLQLQQFIAVLGLEIDDETSRPGNVICLAFMEPFYLMSSPDETVYRVPYQLVLGASSTMEMGFISSEKIVHFYPELLARRQFTDNEGLYPIDFPEWLLRRRRMQYVTTTDWSTPCGACCPGAWRWTDGDGSLIVNHGAYQKCVMRDGGEMVEGITTLDLGMRWTLGCSCPNVHCPNYGKTFGRPWGKFFD
ncbi:hypothetical protein MPER_11705 [Moniliophthora perniciosa FA553]|nr:hypothetical protein MPER_11705 [Moniliophthora perniciosa FA553]